MFIYGAYVFASNILQLEDCIIYDSLTSDKGDWTLYNATYSIDSTGCSVTSSGYGGIVKNTLVDVPFTMEITWISGRPFFLAGHKGTSVDAIYSGGLWVKYWEIYCGGASRNYNSTLNSGDKIKMKVTSTGVYLYRNDSLLVSKTNLTIPSHYIGLRGCDSILKCKDLKVKPYTSE